VDDKKQIDRIIYKGAVYNAVEVKTPCYGCDFNPRTMSCMAHPGYCSKSFRDDGRDVVWKKETT